MLVKCERIHEVYARNILCRRRSSSMPGYAKSCRCYETNECGNIYFREIHRRIENCTKCKLHGKISRRSILANRNLLVIFLSVKEIAKYEREKDRVTQKRMHLREYPDRNRKNSILVRISSRRIKRLGKIERIVKPRVASRIPLRLLARKSMTRGAFSRTDIIVISKMNISFRATIIFV